MITREESCKGNVGRCKVVVRYTESLEEGEVFKSGISSKRTRRQIIYTAKKGDLIPRGGMNLEAKPEMERKKNR